MRTTKRFLFPVLLTVVLYSCTKSTSSDDGTTDGNWVTRSEFDGVARSEAFSFTIADTAYVGTGYDGTKRLYDLWAYIPSQDYWVQKASLPESAARSSAVAFAIGQNGYMATGYDGLDYLKDVWEYSADDNAWTQKPNDFGGSARYEAVGFAINGKGYITTGNDGNYLKDIWEYTPSTDTWVSKISMGGTKREQASVFVYNSKAYIFAGNNNGVATNDLWVYDPSQAETAAWSEKRNIANTSDDSYDDDYAIVRSNAVSFVMGDKGYVTTGENGSILSTTWQYDFATDLWKQKTPYEGSTRTGGIGFAVSGRGFVGMGRNSTYRWDDIREFFPDVEYDDGD